jgi:glycosyltransferase involved in cell wall biosynthesis
MSHSPQASVIMPVYNAELCIGDAIRSVLAQTFSDFEFIIINDGSMDRTNEIIGSFDDKRIRHLKLKSHYGAISAANLGLAEVDSPLIIRMNADCISLPDRFATQVSFMDAHPEIGVCGTATKTFGPKGKINLYPTDHDTIAARMIFENPVANTSAIMRSNLLKEKGFRYRDLFHGMAEYDLWYRLKNVTVFANLPDVLVEVAEKVSDGESIERRREIGASFYVEKLIDFGFQPTIKDLKIHTDLTAPENAPKFSKPSKYRKWLDKLKTSNNISYNFPRNAFEIETEARWKLLFKYLEKKDLEKAVDWLRIDGKSDFYIWKYRIRRIFSSN